MFLTNSKQEALQNGFKTFSVAGAFAKENQISLTNIFLKILTGTYEPLKLKNLSKVKKVKITMLVEQLLPGQTSVNKMFNQLPLLLF